MHERLFHLLARQQSRFLLIGGWNTVVGYAVFVAVHYAAHTWLSTTWILVISYLIAVPHSYFTQRVFVFRAARDRRKQFWKFFLSNSVVFATNLLFLPIFIRETSMQPIYAQAIFVALSTVATYVLHKNFSFADRHMKAPDHEPT